jgi:cephalosporin hydroxylase
VTARQFLTDFPHLVISCLYLDFDIYQPTKVALEHFLPRMPKGSVLVFDELNEEAFPGETIAVMEASRPAVHPGAALRFRAAHFLCGHRRLTWAISRKSRNSESRTCAATRACRQDAVALSLSSIAAKYSYNFFWLGRPIIQYPQDMVALQELIWRVRPDLVIEAGIGPRRLAGTSASMLALLDYCDAVERGEPLDPKATRRRVLGIDIDIRPAQPRRHRGASDVARIDMIEGSSIAPETVARVHARASGHERIMVILDSNHTHEQCARRTRGLCAADQPGSYCVVFDTVVEDLPDALTPDRPWGKGDNPKTARCGNTCAACRSPGAAPPTARA